MASVPMRVLTSDGVRDLDIPDPEDRSLIGEHWNAIQQFLGTGKTDQLARFGGLTVAGVELESDPDTIEDREAEGDLDIDRIYSSRK
jgi:hypothetical protein